MADFLTVNLKNILNSQKSFDDYTGAAQKKNGGNADGPRNLSRISDWKKELATRVAHNRSLPAGERVSEYDVESKFFEDYFYNGHPAWDKSCAKQLISLGEPLKKVMKVLGFSKKTNPILGFITDRYVINNLIKTKLLNASTFKAIYEAVAKKLIANSELLAANDYNIIYCKNLYKKSAAEMLDYIKLQTKVLSPRGEEYSAEDVAKNIKTFFYLEEITEQDTRERKAAIDRLSDDVTLPNAKSNSTTLNKLAFAKVMISDGDVEYDDEEGTDETDDNAEASNGDEGGAKKQPITASELVAKLRIRNDDRKSKAQYFTALQYFSMTLGSDIASRALKSSIFSEVTGADIAAASTSVAKVLKNKSFTEKEIKSFISSIGLT